MNITRRSTLALCLSMALPVPAFFSPRVELETLLGNGCCS